MSKNKGRFLLRQYGDAHEISDFILFDEASVASAATSSSSSSTSAAYSNPRLSLSQEARNSAWLFIEGPINGLYCVYKEPGRAVIWNPAIEEAVFLPFPEEFLPIGYESYGSYIDDGVIGFGTDPLNEEDDKVVLIFFYEKEDSHEVWGFCRMLYTTGTNTWRILEGDDFVGPGWPDGYTSNNTYLNGIYYWLTKRDQVALAFNMGKAFFRCIPTPYINSASYSADLALHNNHINLFIVNRNLCKIDIWVLMVEENTWIKKISVGGIRGVEKSLGFWKNDDELLLVINDLSRWHSSGQTILYNTSSKEITNIGPKGFGDLFKTSVHYESLVSVAGGITKDKRNHASLLGNIRCFLFKKELAAVQRN